MPSATSTRPAPADRKGLWPSLPVGRTVAASCENAGKRLREHSVTCALPPAVQALPLESRW